MADTQIDLNIADYFDGDSTELEFNMADFELVDFGLPATRYTKPKFSRKPVTAKYTHAAELARKVKLYPGEQLHCIVPGNFIFGDFIEALLVEKQAVCTNMHIATLSLSQANIDSLANVLDFGYVKRLTMIVSNYFYSHERRVLMPYMLERLDKDNRFECCVLRNHCKIVLMEIANIKLILSGSSNLRSSQSVEQFVLQESPELYEWYKQWFDENLQYTIIDRGEDNGS